MNCLIVLREALWAYIEYKRIPPNPRLEGYDYTTLNTTNITHMKEYKNLPVKTTDSKVQGLCISSWILP